MTEFRDDGESLHGVGDCGVCVLCGAPPSTARINASVPFSICELHTHFAPAYYAVDTVRAAMREYARRVSNALSAPVRENPSTPECLHGPFCCQCEMNRLQAGEGPSRFGDGEAREKAGETSEPNRIREERDHYREKLFECQAQLAERTAELSSLTQRISDIAWENGGPVPVQTADENLTSIERYAHELRRELAERMTDVERLKAELENLQANPCQCEFGEYGWSSSRCPMHRAGEGR